MRWFEKQRIAWIAARQEPFNRKDLVEAFEISVPQASKDIKAYLSMHPKSWAYNTKTKQYERRQPQ